MLKLIKKLELTSKQRNLNVRSMRFMIFKHNSKRGWTRLRRRGKKKSHSFSTISLSLANSTLKRRRYPRSKSKTRNPTWCGTDVYRAPTSVFWLKNLMKSKTDNQFYSCERRRSNCISKSMGSISSISFRDQMRFTPKASTSLRKIRKQGMER